MATFNLNAQVVNNSGQELTYQSANTGGTWGQRPQSFPSGQFQTLTVSGWEAFSVDVTYSLSDGTQVTVSAQVNAIESNTANMTIEGPSQNDFRVSSTINPHGDSPNAGFTIVSAQNA